MITNSKGQVVASFVEIDNVRISSAYLTETDCSNHYDAVNGGAAYPSGGTKCDVTANLYSNPVASCTSTTDPGCWYKIHTEFDQDWQGAGYCGPGTVCDPAQAQSQIVAKSTYIDVQGFVFWDPAHVTEQWHSYSGWELHPLTAWRLHQSSSQPDFGISASPSSVSILQGSSATSTITLTSLNGFTGTVAMGATVSPGGPTVSLNPTSLTLSSGSSASSTLSISASSSIAPGSYNVQVTGTSGTTSHSTVLSLTVTSSASGDFSMVASPSSTSQRQGSTATSTIGVNSLNGFSGTVTLGATVSSSGPTLSLKPTSLTLRTGGSASSALTISVGNAVPPGSYSITVTGTSGLLSHATQVSLTVTPSTTGDLSISANPSSLNVPRGGSAVSTISLTSLNGFAGNVTLSATASVGKLRTNLSPGSVTLVSGGSGAATLTVAPRLKLPPGSYAVTVTAASGTISHSVTIFVTVS